MASPPVTRATSEISNAKIGAAEIGPAILTASADPIESCSRIVRGHLDYYSPGGKRMLLTKHEGQTFQNQTIYLSGQAFVRCNFIACTLVLRETVYYLEGCSFERCNWHVDWVLMWGSPESIREIKALVSLIEQAQSQQLPPEALTTSVQMPPRVTPLPKAPPPDAQ